MSMPEEPDPLGVHFSNGYGSSRGIESPGLEAQGARWSELGAESASTPHSVLNQLSPSPIAANLSAPSQESRLMPNGFVLSNTQAGASPTTAATENFLATRGEADFHPTQQGT